MEGDAVTRWTMVDTRRETRGASHSKSPLEQLREELAQARKELEAARAERALHSKPQERTPMTTDTFAGSMPHPSTASGTYHSAELHRRADALLAQGLGLTAEEKHSADRAGIPHKFVLMAKLEGL